MKKIKLVSRLRDLSLERTGKKEKLRIRLKSALEISERESKNEVEKN